MCGVVRFVQFSYYKTANRTAPCDVVRCDALLLAVRCGAVMAFCRRFWCGLCSLYGLVNTPSQERYSLSYLKAKAHSSIHSNPFHLFINKKKDLHLFVDREINRFKVAVISLSLCTSLGF